MIMKKNHAAIALIAIFWALLLLPQVFRFLDQNPSDVAAENRNISRFPRLKWSRFATGFEAYYNDRIPFRSKLLNCCRVIQNSLFSFPLGAVIPGKEDFSFYSPKNERNSILQYRGKIRFTAYELATHRTWLEKLHRILKEKNIEFLLVVAPDKIQVYPEHLPERRRFKQSADAPFVQFREYMQKHNSPVPRLYLLDELLKAKEFYGNDLYYRNDSHWNRVGGYIGAAAIIRRLSPGAKLAAPGEFKVLTESTAIEPSDMKAQLLHADFMKDHPDKYPDVPAAALAPAASYHVSRNPAAPDKRKVLIFRDSFTINMSPWLSLYFAEVHYVWSPRISLAKINEIKPDIVVAEYLSRLLIKMSGKLK